jgi:hypothetical protein
MTKYLPVCEDGYIIQGLLGLLTPAIYIAGLGDSGSMLRAATIRLVNHQENQVAIGKY